MKIDFGLAGILLPLAMALGDEPINAAAGGERAKLAPEVIAIDHPDLALAPYVWKLTGNGRDARAEATMPGAISRRHSRAAIRSASSSMARRTATVQSRRCPSSNTR